MLKLKDQRINVADATDGKWFTLRGGLRVKLSRINTPQYKARLAELMEPYANLLRDRKALPDGAMNRVTVECMSEMVIRDWEPFEGDNGEPVSYSPEEALKLLQDPELVDIRDEIVAIAESVAGFRKATIQAAEKN